MTCMSIDDTLKSVCGGFRDNIVRVWSFGDSGSGGRDVEIDDDGGSYGPLELIGKFVVLVL